MWKKIFDAFHTYSNHFLNTYVSDPKWFIQISHNWLLEYICELLAHPARVTHIYVNDISAIIGLDNDLLPFRHQDIIKTNDVLLLIGCRRTNLSEIPNNSKLSIPATKLSSETINNIINMYMTPLILYTKQKP